MERVQYFFDQLTSPFIYVRIHVLHLTFGFSLEIYYYISVLYCYNLISIILVNYEENSSIFILNKLFY